MGRFVAQLALGFAFLGVAILLGRGARAIWTFPEDSLLPLMMGWEFSCSWCTVFDPATRCVWTTLTKSRSSRASSWGR